MGMLNNYRKLQVTLKVPNKLIEMYSQESFASIMDLLNEDKFIMLFDLSNGLYIPCAVNTDNIVGISRAEEN
ncbi:hypothetical protein [Bacillus thuringiensis]|uniref:Uncharacterized protein n=1 Tax=Bacillus thuringiensis serovar andalousiensis TaxID=257985 RepID=A0A6H0TNB8_BACTU|nr:hypothetical protein [Bacillus thuringiensis]QIW22442.1 hypothetical protein EVG22_31095 [Bacillus thuringiensis serovar andalousiensis]